MPEASPDHAGVCGGTFRTLNPKYTMPIQIRELIVTATVDEQRTNAVAPATKSEAVAKESEMKAELIQACVDEVLKVLKQQARR
jgi:hypothetical protein